jgi:arylsulfatase A-like enzyme
VVEHTDLLPTVADFVGATSALAAQAAPVQGRSLLPVLRGERADPKRAALVQRRSYVAPPPGRELVEYELGEKFALIEKEWKLIHRTIGVDELYHQPSDPYEDKNLIDRYAQRASAMKRSLLDRVGKLRMDASPEAESVDAETLERLRAMGYAE